MTVDAEHRGDGSTPRIVWRARLLAVCLGLMALSFAQKPGAIVADTKLDLTVNPGGLLTKGFELWDPSAAFGQLQNQAYGYLFPMGPFFWAADVVGLSEWVTQRLWWSLLLIVAFLGMWRLSAALVHASRWARLAGALVYALSPKILAELTITSIEVWPMAIAPWVLWPLVYRAPRTWWWRVTRSALAVACLGGVNAVASGAALVLPGLWFLTRRPALRTYVHASAWLLGVLAATAWWLGPLVVLGRYSPPFLDWIEGIATTSSTASVFEAFKGTTAWLGFLLTSNGPTWPGGFLLVSEPALIIATSVVAVGGLVGIGLKGRVREPLFLAVSVLVGLLLLTAGHLGATTSIIASPLRELLDGSLAALRNLHKFDVVVRIPLALGAMASIDALARVVTRARLVPALVPMAVCLVIVSVASPALVGQLARPESYRALPTYWKQAARWLDSQPEEGAVLVLPAAGTADFEWGSTKDNPLQPLLERPFVHRDGVPLGSAGATRFLDGVEDELGRGQGGEHVRDALTAAGIRYVLVPNDARFDAVADDMVRIHSGLEKSGIQRVASFGHTASTLADTSQQTADYRSVLSRPRIEVYLVGDVVPVARTTRDVLLADGVGPEDLLTLSRSLGESVAVLGTDGDLLSRPPAVLMDGLGRRETNFGQIAGNRSHLLSAVEAPSQDRAAYEYQVFDEPGSTQEWDGLAGVQASSSASSASATLRLGPGYGPAAALDNDPSTAWVSGRSLTAVGEWLQLDFEFPTQVGAVTVETYHDDRLGAPPARLAFETANGSVTAPVFPNGRADAEIPEGLTPWLRIRLAAVGDGAENGFAITQVSLKDRLIAPRTAMRPLKEENEVILHRGLGEIPGCVEVEGTPRCNPEAERRGEEPSVLRRSINVETSGSFTASGWVTPRMSDALDDYLDTPTALTATASSRLVAGPAMRPGAAVDADEGTGWVAGLNDFDPWLRLQLPEPRRIAGLEFTRDETLPGSRPRSIEVTFDNGSRVKGTVNAAGFIGFPARKTKSIRIRFEDTDPLVSISSRSGWRSFTPVGVSEVKLIRAEELNGSLPLQLASGANCGFGPAIHVNGVQYPTRVSGTLADIRSGARLRWELCGRQDIPLKPGRNAVDLVASAQFTPDSLVLDRVDHRRDESTEVAMTITRTGSSSLTLTVDEPGIDRLAVIPQNYNPGWQAHAEDKVPLTPVRVNGWMQGWIVPAGATNVDARFLPNRSYQLSLVVGAILLAFLCIVAGRSARGDTVLPPRPIVLSSWIAALGLGAAALLIGGWWLALGAVLAMIWVQVVTRRGWRGALPGSIIASCLAAAAIVAARPWPTSQSNLDSMLVQILVFVGVSAALIAAFEATSSGSRRSRRGAPHGPSASAELPAVDN